MILKGQITKFFSSLKQKKLEQFQDSNEGESFNEILSKYFNENKFINNIEFINLGYFYLENEGFQRYTEIYTRNLKFNEETVEFLIYDVSQIKLSEKINTETKYKQKIQAKLCHEFKTPTISIITLINKILKQQNNPDSFERTKKNLNRILNLSNYNIFLTNDLIQYVSGSVDSNILKDDVNLSEVINYSYRILNTLVECDQEIAGKIETKLVIQEEISNVRIITDENRLKQIILNLISNSVKFTKSGYIKLEVKISSKTKTIKIKVKDSGIGIREVDKNIIFQNDPQLNIENNYNRKGCGLGLSLCKILAESLGYEIGYKSQYKAGSKFYIDLKNANIISNERRTDQLIETENNSINQDIQSISNEVKQKNMKLINEKFLKEDLGDTIIKKGIFYEKIENLEIHNFSLNYINDNYYDIKSKFCILVIDDQKLVRKSTVNLIKNVLISHNVLNYSIIEGSDGIDLLKLVREDTNNNIKCIFIDENMKCLMGSEAVKIVRRLQVLNRINTYYIASVTAFDDDQTKKEIVISGVNTILGKPCSKSSICTVLKNLNIVN